MKATRDDTRHDEPPASSEERPDPAVKADTRRPSAPPPERRAGAGKWVALFVVLALAVVAALLWMRSGEHGKLTESTHDLAQNRVIFTHPAAGQTESEIVLPGNLQAFNEATIFARTNGYLKAWHVDIGAKVTEGQVLAEIEAPDVDAQLRQATASLAQAKSNLEIANLNFARQKDLLEKKVASQQEFDQNRTNVDAMRASVQAGEANVQNLTTQRDFQMLKAPFAGVVTRRSTDVGALISASNGQELFRIARTDTLRVNVYVPQTYAAKVKEGANAFLVFAEFPGEKIPGKVAHIAGAIDPATRTLQTEIQVDNKSGRLFPGSFANAHLLLPLQTAPTVVPVNTLLFRKEGLQVAVVDKDGIVRLRKVTIGQDFGATLEVLHGVAREDRVVVNPSDSLQDGTKVEATEQPAASKDK